MRTFLLCLLALSLYAVTGYAQEAVGARADERGRVELTTSIIRQRSCLPNTLNLDLRLSFRNTGTEPVILSKKSLQARMMISRSAEEAAAGKYARSLSYSLFANEDRTGSDFNAPTDLSGYVILRPGEVYESEDNVGLTTYEPAMTVGPRSFPEVDFTKGTHFLQIGVLTWPYGDDPAPLREQWKTKGVLWTKGLNSAPMPFTVDDASRGQSKCP